MNLDQLINAHDDQFPFNRWRLPNNWLFSEGDMAAYDYDQGTGLSLSLGIVRAHSGEIVVDSTKNEGSIFTLTLPIN